MLELYNPREDVRFPPPMYNNRSRKKYLLLKVSSLDTQMISGHDKGVGGDDAGNTAFFVHGLGDECEPR